MVPTNLIKFLRRNNISHEIRNEDLPYQCVEFDLKKGFVLGLIKIRLTPVVVVGHRSRVLVSLVY